MRSQNKQGGLASETFRMESSDTNYKEVNPLGREKQEREAFRKMEKIYAGLL